MYKRFLNNKDYLGIITSEALNQMTRGLEERYVQAEEAAEASIIEYLTDNYEVEKELEVGKRLMEYNPQITYPVGAHFYKGDKICEAIRAIHGVQRPTSKVYWVEIEYNEQKIKDAVPYMQLRNWQPGDVVEFQNTYFECVEPNGIDFRDIRIPGIVAWEELEVYDWMPNVQYASWDAVHYNGQYFALVNWKEDMDLTVNPFDSDDWGLVGTYDETYTYTLSPTEYVEFEGKLYIPVIKPSADTLEEGYNIRFHDPRNGNIKKHMVRLALYELCKLISPNNISSARIVDYETSITWLRDANRCKINPQIPRKMDDENKPVTEFAIATFQRDYDPRNNPWHI